MPVRFPFGPGEILTPAFAATIAATVRDAFTRIAVPGAASAGFTLNLTLSSELRVGDELEVIWTSDATARALTLGTGFAANQPTVAGVASDQVSALFRFNGTAFESKGSATN
jgi:hypothetical protein